MKKIALSIIIIVLGYLGYGQSFNLDLPNTLFQAEYGAGFDTRIYLGFINSNHGKAYLSAQTPQGITAIFQPDTVSINDTIVLSVMVTDSNLIGQTLTIPINAIDSMGLITKTIHIQVTNNWGTFPSYPATTYRDQAINYLNTMHPEIISDYGNMLSYDWQGFWQFPPLLVVSNYVFLINNWRCNVLWHIMIPPYDWKKIFIYNDIENICWGVNIDTDGNITEIPCEKHYYFYQDSNDLSIRKDFIESTVVSIYPNPCNSFTTIIFSNPHKRSCILNIFSSHGQLVKEIKDITSNEVKLENIRWRSGLYFYQLSNESGIMGIGKILKHSE
jgi:hypothetical protein